MSEYVDAMNALLRAKKENNKKEPSLAEKEQFMQAWKSLVLESGFSKEVEGFLYDGFAFCGAEPFYWYLCQSDEQNDVLRQLFSGRRYGKDSNVTFRVLVHLFALFLNGKVSPDVLAPIIVHFPSACVNKEGNRLGTAAKTMEKYFFGILSPSVELVPLADIGENPLVIDAFISSLSKIVYDIKDSKTIKEPIATNITKVSAWAREYLDTLAETKGSVEAATDVSDRETVNRVSEKTKDDNKENPVSQSVNQPKDSLESLSALLKQAIALSNRIQNEREIQRTLIRELEAQTEEARQKLAQSEETLKMLESAVQERNESIRALEQKCKLLNQTVSEKEAVIADKDKEIKERMIMLEVLDRDKSRQADESLQRIASKIRIEYRDFMDALDAEMTVDLGENLRYQLISIFDILEKGGMKIK